ncbi:hypothetical protein [Salibacterium halotolerans]|uniref:Uncharacterized protein n=1 Tax=Salibacterium halotolerans TaxID=1884432 RepID=A0A1I5N7B6_9BACI|nr:hypothetical protein [Salibacterium halotolerans]SFP17492.1 hypothetical protein SAMN05518683_10318 [Salibacterium halotolerans]
MQNKTEKARLYNPSAIPTILKTARERAKKPERRTKRWLAEQLGMTERRLTGIEDGTSQVHLEECIEWCEAVEDFLALKHILHIYGISEPPTDPRLLDNVPSQLDNFKAEVEESFIAAKDIEKLSQHWRPWKGFEDRDRQQMQASAKQIRDVRHAADCLIVAMENQWGLNQQYVEATWINGGIANNILMHSIGAFENLRKERTDRERMAQLGEMKS